MAAPLKVNSNLILLSQWCNIFGGENDGGAKAVLGGIGPQTPARQWYCPTKAIGRYVMTCEHGHKGQIMHLCGKHKAQFGDAVTFCPKCNTNPPGHKCKLIMTEVS
jgi:hypothetical protein